MIEKSTFEQWYKVGHTNMRLTVNHWQGQRPARSQCRWVCTVPLLVSGSHTGCVWHTLSDYSQGTGTSFKTFQPSFNVVKRWNIYAHPNFTDQTCQSHTSFGALLLLEIRQGRGCVKKQMYLTSCVEIVLEALEVSITPLCEMQMMTLFHFLSNCHMYNMIFNVRLYVQLIQL